MREICKKKFIAVSPESIDRPNNIMKDALRRCGNSDSWSIKCLAFRMVGQKWGPHPIDRFALQINKKYMRFIWASMREKLSWGGGCEQHRRRPACASVQSDQRLCYSLFGKHHTHT